MLERYLSHILTTKFGHIVENLDENKVRVSAWNGEVVLEDLNLKQNSLDAFVSDSPLEIRYGRIGKLELLIPWKVLRSRTKDVKCSVVLSDVCILIAPKRATAAEDEDDETEPSVAEKRTAKEERVQALMDANLFKRRLDGQTRKTQQWQWAEEWMTSLLSNLSVTVNNVHIRYEDPGNSFGLVWNDSNVSSAFSVGMTLRQFSVQTTDRGSPEEEESFAASDSFSVTQKLAAAYQLSIYWDRGCPLMSMQVAKIVDQIGFNIGEERDYYLSSFHLLNGNSTDVGFVHSRLYKATEHNYVLNPISPSLQIALVRETVPEKKPKNQQPMLPIDLPPSSAVLTLPPTQFVVSKDTLEETAYLRKCFATWNQMRKNQLPNKAVRRLTKIRPQLSPLKDPRTWWKYAIEATVIILKSSTEDGVSNLQQNQKRGWLSVARALGSRGKYSRLYLLFMASTRDSEKQQIHQELVKMEDTLEAEAIVAFRIYSFTLQRENGQHSSDTSIGDIQAEDAPAMAEKADELYPLSVDHRYIMYQEMSRILDQEKSLPTASESKNKEEDTLTEHSESAIVWKTLLVCPEISVQVNKESRSEVRRRQRKNGTHGQGKPIARLACASLFRQILRADGSWNSTTSISSLEMLDLTSRRGNAGTLFPVLVGRKAYDLQQDSLEETVLIQGVNHRLCISVAVSRKCERGRVEDSEVRMVDLGSSTTTTVRLLPLQVVYSTKPIAVLSNILMTVKTPELANDFHRMASVVSKWQNSQRKRLLLALAHKKKKIIVDIDVAAPVLFVPEDVHHNDSPMLVIDLGRLQFCNAHEDSSLSRVAYDDMWKLGLSSIQVLSTTTAWYGASAEERRLPHQIVEPFSLDFTISTTISAEEAGYTNGGKTVVHISATLPRLVFNLTTSAVRLLLRLQRQWKHHSVGRVERERVSANTGQIEVLHDGLPTFERPFDANDINRENSAPQQARTIQFDFSAPLIGLKLENDVDGRDLRDGTAGQLLSEINRKGTTLGHLVFRGIRGTYQQEVSALGTLFGSFKAKMRSLEAIDLYQQAGDDFLLFLSSVSPDLYDLETFSVDKILGDDPKVGDSETDLVSICYLWRKRGMDTPTIPENASDKDTIAISFHELFVEWNPETVAAIHKAMKLPSGTFEIAKNVSFEEDVTSEEEDDSVDSSDHEHCVSDDEFFDALEGHEDCGIPLSPQTDGDSRALSEISSCSSRADEEQHFIVARSDLGMIGSPYPASIWSHLSPAGPLRTGYSPSLKGMLSPMVSSAVNEKITDGESEAQETQGSNEWRPFELTFELLKLRVRFNKESRRRRLLVAEMDGTAVRYMTRQEGGSVTTARIGNLSLSDPSTKTNSTLYNEIVGLQSDNFARSAGKKSSLLELTFLSNPKIREIVSVPRIDNLFDGPLDENAKACVTIDTNLGTVSGSDYFVSLQFSPMRFVYLQQFWFEIIDYFFEGVIGTEVWGGTKPPPLSIQEYFKSTNDGLPNDPMVKRALPGADANGLRFTRFLIEVDSPIVLVPVAYRSPQFLRLEFDSLKVANRYTSAVESTKASSEGTTQERLQWFNNCVVTLKELRIKSWCGTELSRTDAFSSLSRPSHDAEINLSWPTGPGAPLVRPKWNVDCRLDAISIYLRKVDYALLQNVIMHNIGEPSRHLDEWIELQALPMHELERYKKQIMVHFGYDKKDDIPTTYKVEVKVPSLNFFLVERSAGSSGESIAAEAQCVNLVWGMAKLADCIGRQKVSCDIVISQPTITDGQKKTVHLILPSEPHLTRGHSNTPTQPSTASWAPAVPELVYTSTSRASGDNVKTLDIANACIHFAYPAWIRVASFFSGLEMPEIWTEKEVSSSMQIADRWYQIGGSYSQEQTTENTVKVPVPPLRRSSSSFCGDLPSHQFHLRLVTPRVVLNSTGDGSENASIVLRMDHLDYLHVSNCVGTMTRSFFVHNLELYTSTIEAVKRDKISRKNSLIRPWSTIGIYERCNQREARHCHEHRMTVHAEVLQARAAYSDMSIAVDVVLRLLSDLRSRTSSKENKSSLEADPGLKTAPEGAIFVCTPLVESVVIGIEGIDVLVVDDSMRHFAEAQELVELSLTSMRLLREKKIDSESLSVVSTRVQLASLNLFDHLQPVESPFRLAATSQEGEMIMCPSRSGVKTRLKWTDYASTRSEFWGVKVSDVLIAELRTLAGILAFEMSPTQSPGNSIYAVDLRSYATAGVSRLFEGNLTSLTLQWNPSTVIALQRFLGRLVKEASQKSVSAYQESLDDLLSSPSLKNHHSFDSREPLPDPDSSLTSAEPIKASLRLNSLTLCFNKEHQSRRLLKATFTNSGIDLWVDSDRGVLLQGTVEDVAAWDADDYADREIYMIDSNRKILRVVGAGTDACFSPKRSQRFFYLEFKTYPSKATPLPTSFPNWIQTLLASMNDESQQVDDYLSINIAALEFVYLRERTDELLDYLSNGLPGKGMGATSRAAKGFIKKRIQTRSFLKLAVDSPQLKVPQREGALIGILLRLGDFGLQSWFQEGSVGAMADFSSNKGSAVQDDGDKDWWRMLTLSILGLGWETYGETNDSPTATKQMPVDLLLDLRKPRSVGRTTLLKASLSYVDLLLAYSDYVLCRSVLKENIGKKIEIERWDNVEKAYWMEQESSEKFITERILTLEKTVNHRVAYSSNARFVRYGKKSKAGATIEEVNESGDQTKARESAAGIPEALPDDKALLNFKFDLGGLRLTLHRDDPIEGLADIDFSSSFYYDVVLLRVENIETTMTTSRSGDRSFHLSLYRMGVFDLGDLGRLARHQYYQNILDLTGPKKMRSPSAFCVLAEGYSSSDKLDSENMNEGDAQLVVTIDTCPASSIGSVGPIQSFDLGSEKVTIARVVVNHLSVNVLVRPIQEIGSFLACAWPLPRHDASSVQLQATHEAGAAPSPTSLKGKPDSKSSGFQLKLVAHYPRIFFVADESDPHSRALVLRGLAVINASFLTQKMHLPSSENVPRSRSLESQVITALDAHLHSMESYINPDVSWALGLQRQHAVMMGRSLEQMLHVYSSRQESPSRVLNNSLGVALIEPVTTSIELCRVSKDRFPTLRSVAINMEPVSTMLSFEDLSLIRGIIDRLSSSRGRRRAKKESTQQLLHNIDAPPLEMPLEFRNEFSKQKELSVEELIVEFKSSRLGLVLRSSNCDIVVEGVHNVDHSPLVKEGDRLLSIDGSSVTTMNLQEVVQTLALKPRPTTLVFHRLVATSKDDAKPFAASNQPEVSIEDQNEIDVVETSEAAYTISFVLGLCNGVSLERSPGCNAPVITSINLDEFLTAVVVHPGEESAPSPGDMNLSRINQAGRIPRKGAVIAGVDGLKSTEIGYEKTAKIINEFCGHKAALHSFELDTKKTYSLTFVELDSDNWGTIDRVDIAVTGISLTFIDDIKGRDMPLFRGRLSGIELRLERGIGIETALIESKAPIILQEVPAITNDCPPKRSSVGNNVDGQTWGHLAKPIIKSFAILQAEVEYYHPKIAVWEPLIEPSQFCAAVEWQPGYLAASKPRCGQLAIRISDHVTSSDQTATARVGVQQVVTVNLTDASVEVIMGTFREWKDWMKTSVTSPESNSDLLELSSVASPMRSMNSKCLNEGTEPSSNTDKLAGTKKIAPQKAAQAALVFAQKRGASTKKQGDSSKPFVLRNRTGLELQFSYEKSDSHIHDSLSEQDDSILCDGQDARFSMEMLSNAKSDQGAEMMNSFRRGVQKVRTYEGRFPRLSVSFHAPDGAVLAPLRELQASKVGTTLRHTNCVTLNGVVSSVPVLWTVEVEDNRRILTISSSVKINSTGLGTSIEVGYADPLLLQGSLKSGIATIGSAKPGLPFFVPIWLTLRLEVASIFVRPICQAPSETNPFSWSMCQILHFSRRRPLESFPMEEGVEVAFGEAKTNRGEERWAWRETFPTSCSVSCLPCDTGMAGNIQTVWLSCRIEPRDPELYGINAKKHTRSSIQDTRQEMQRTEDVLQEVISISIDSSMTLRNMLPSHLEWQIALKSEATMTIVAGSGFGIEKPTLAGGDCVEIIACDVMSSDAYGRFRCKQEHEWTQWESISLDLSTISQANSSRTEKSFDRANELTDIVNQIHDSPPKPRQINVQSIDEFGCRLTLGLRMLPKLVKTKNAAMEMTCYGIDVIVYAELWLRNKTSLPLSFGCPSFQIESRQSSGFADTYQESGKMVAEAALLEIASVLEFGDKGKNLRNKEESQTNLICPLPFQEASLVYYEVFEYVEIESSVEKRRWWACENPASQKWAPHQLSDKPVGWHWLDDTWQIDISGQTSPAEGGWESCRNLFGLKEFFFNGNRIFSAGHPFRRRRWLRRWAADSFSEEKLPKKLYGEINAFHQPVVDSFSKAQLRAARRAATHQKGNSEASARNLGEEEYSKKDAVQISIKSGDGDWCSPANIPPTGSAHGVLRVPASRWAVITKTSWATAKELRDPSESSVGGSEAHSQKICFGKANLSPELYELCYDVQDLAGDWGDFSRLLDVTPRFLLQNDSEKHPIEVKQSGASTDAAIVVAPGAVAPFHWADFRLPELLSVRPYSERGDYRWSGGFDISRLGMTPIRVRRSNRSEDGYNTSITKSVRALVEIRPGSGGSGMKVSFREEEPKGDGALFRIENHSPFPIWLTQDGVLANPSTKVVLRLEMPTSLAICENGSLHSTSWSDERAEIDGDLIRPNSQTAYALDIPFRQGKYSHRNVATMEELLRVRIGLAPLSSRDGIETTKVIGLTQVGERIRLNITKIGTIAASGITRKISSVRVMGIVATDGPTRVLKFSLIEKEDPSDFLNAFSEGIGYSAKQPHEVDAQLGHRLTSSAIGQDEFWRQLTKRAALEALEAKSKGQILPEEQAKRRAFFGDGKRLQNPRAIQEITDVIYSFQASFSGFLFSLVDSTPSEIAVISLKGLNVVAKWDGERKADASALISVDWLQVDNHIPGAPFPVAICPDAREKEDASSEQIDVTSLLVIGLTFAPKHKTGILCLRNMTVAPRNLALAVDLAFIVRLQRYLIGLQEHAMGGRIGDSEAPLGVKHAIPLPEISTLESWKKAISTRGRSPKLYFEGLTILSADINLSVAPARALTKDQAALEGSEAAAIHAAVRKGDIGLASGLVGVHVGRTNKTAMAVVRGVFKSILVDALLRLDGASLNLSGVVLRNHISTTPQLLTFLGAHYVSSIRSNLPALLGSLAAFGNPLGLIRGLGDGVSDFVNEPVKGLKKSVQELDPFLFVDGVARGTESLARHTVGGIAETASLLTETFSKNMAVLTLDRRYAQRRDRVRGEMRDGDVTFVGGVESGVVQLVRGVVEGVAGVVKAPMRGAERNGVEGFAKGIGKGLLGLLVKPMIGISDAATDFMIGVKGSVEGGQVQRGGVHNTRQIRPRRPMYGRDRVLRSYAVADAAAATLMLRTRLAGDNYLSHLDMGDRVALLSVKDILLLGADGKETLFVKFKHVKAIEVRPFVQTDGSDGWGIVIMLAAPRRNGSEVEVINCGKNRQMANELCAQMNQGLAIMAGDT